MKALSVELTPGIEGNDVHGRTIRLWKAVGVASFAIGTLIGLVGLLLSLLSAVGLVNYPVLVKIVEPGLIIAALVMLILGSHSLDRTAVRDHDDEALTKS